MQNAFLLAHSRKNVFAIFVLTVRKFRLQKNKFRHFVLPTFGYVWGFSIVYNSGNIRLTVSISIFKILEICLAEEL